MSKQHAEFRGRLRHIQTQRTAFARDGYTARLRSDGLIEVVPQRRIRSRIATGPVLLFIAAVFLFKGLLMGSLGFDSYDRRVADLANGSAIEQLGAFVMQSDPISHLVAEKLGPLLP